MYQTVEMSCRLLDRLSHLIVAIKIEHIRNKIQGVLIVLHLSLQTRQIESVGKVVFVDLAEIFVASRGDELHQSAVSKLLQL